MNGYEEAAKIDQQITTLIQENPLTHHSAGQWLRFLRTIRTTIDLLEPGAERVRRTWHDANPGSMLL